MAQAAATIDRILGAQSMMIATDRVFFACALALAIAAFAIWISPKAKAVADMAGIH